MPTSIRNPTTAKAAPRGREATALARADHEAVNEPFSQDEKSRSTQVEGVEPDGETFDAKVKGLSEYVKHHVQEEHTEMLKGYETGSLRTGNAHHRAEAGTARRARVV